MQGDKVQALLVEDDPAISAHVRNTLSEAGFVVEVADNGPDAWERGVEGEHDIVVLDLGLPGLDGMTILKRWRREGMDKPVIVLTARGSWMERVDGFEAGADDYLPKPFRAEELVARMKALLRRAKPTGGAKLSSGRLLFDENTMTVRCDGKSVDLSPLESRALHYFLTRPGKVVSPSELSDQVQGRGEEGGNNAVEAMIARLRKKLGSDIILTRRGFGYYMPETAE